MKNRVIVSLLCMITCTGIMYAQHDTMYIMKSGHVIGKYNTLDIDSIVFYVPAMAGNTVSDADGNEYNTVIIGTQTWMAENLKTTHYADGSPIPGVSGNANWAALTSSSQAYCWYNDDSINHAATYGALYTWAAAMKGSASSDAVPSGIQGICPDGWHLPSDAEWTTLQNYLITHGFNYDGTTTGNKIGKSLAANNLWRLSTYEGTVGNADYPAFRNKSGFSALPGGYRDQWGDFFYLENEGLWWTSTEYTSMNAWFRSLAYFSVDLYRLPPGCFYKKLGFSVRCLKD